MNRLPTLDRATRWGELGSFASLALAGVAIIAMAGAQMTRFADSHQRVAEALAAPNAVTAAVSHSSPDIPSATNRAPARELLSATQVRLVPPRP